MKNCAETLCVILAIFCLSSCSGTAAKEYLEDGARKKMSVDEYFHLTNFGPYVEGTGKAFINDFVATYQNVIPIDEPPGKLIGFAFQFNGGYVVEIYAYNLIYTQRFTEDRQWRLEDFLQEKISKIVVKRHGDLPFRREFPSNSNNISPTNQKSKK